MTKRLLDTSVPYQMKSLDRYCYIMIPFCNSINHKEVSSVKMVRMLIQVPEPLKAKLDALRDQGTTASGFIRWLLERHFKQTEATARKGQ